MKRILMMLAACAAVLGIGVGPATAGGACYCSPWDYFKQVDCGSAPQTGHLAINKDNSDHLWVEGDINDAGSGAPHGWSWDLYHNGDRSFSGAGQGSFTVHREMVNLPGQSETVKFVAVSGSKTCSATITVFGQ